MEVSFTKNYLQLSSLCSLCNCFIGYLIILINLQPTKPFIATSATNGGVDTTPLRFRVRFKILYHVIKPLIQHCLLRKMVYLNILYVIATRNYDLFNTGIVL